MALIHELLPKVSADIGYISKDHTNSFHKYKFRSVEDALNICGPYFAKHGVTVSVDVRSHEVRVTEGTKKNGDKQLIYHSLVKMGVWFWAPDGSSLENVTAAEGLDYDSDKSSAKAIAACFKMALFLGLCLGVQPFAIEDSDHEAGEAPAANGNGKAAPTPTHAPGDDVKPYILAKGAIENAMTLDRLNKLSIAIKNDLEFTDKFTADEGKTLEALLIMQRGKIESRQPAKT